LFRPVLRISIVVVLTAVAFLRGPVAFVQAGDISSDTEQSGSSESGDAVGGQVVGVSSSGDTSIDATNRSEDVDVSTGDVSGSNTHESTVSGSTGGGDPFDLVLQAVEDFTGGDFPDDSTREDVIEFLRDVTGLPEDAPDEALLDAFAAIGAPPEDLEILAAFLRGDEFVGGAGGVGLDSSVGQTAEVFSGDAVAGQAVGVVTTLGATADLVLSNETLDTTAESGDASFTNASSQTTAVASPK
jgi:hypothetical protein